MDLRKVIDSAISHVNNAKREIENLPPGSLAGSANLEMELAYNALEDSIQHCQGIFGPSELNTNPRRRDLKS